MEWVFKLCGIFAIQFNSVVEALDFVAGNCPKRRLLLVICYGTLWNIRKARNDVYFSKKGGSHGKTKGVPLG